MLLVGGPHLEEVAGVYRAKWLGASQSRFPLEIIWVPLKHSKAWKSLSDVVIHLTGVWPGRLGLEAPKMQWEALDVVRMSVNCLAPGSSPATCVCPWLSYTHALYLGSNFSAFKFLEKGSALNKYLERWLISYVSLTGSRTPRYLLTRCFWMCPRGFPRRDQHVNPEE